MGGTRAKGPRVTAACIAGARPRRPIREGPRAVRGGIRASAMSDCAVQRGSYSVLVEERLTVIPRMP